MWRGLSCVKVAGRRRKSPQKKKKKRAQRPTDHRMHLNWFIKAPRPSPHPLPPPVGLGSSSPPGTRFSPLRPATTFASPRRARLSGHAVVVSSCSRTAREPHHLPATVGRLCGEPRMQLGRAFIAGSASIAPIARTYKRRIRAEMTSYLSRRHRAP